MRIYGFYKMINENNLLSSNHFERDIQKMGNEKRGVCIRLKRKKTD